VSYCAYCGEKRVSNRHPKTPPSGGELSEVAKLSKWGYKKSPIIGYEPKLSFFTFKPSEHG
jgi:hypothetical protein